MVTDLKSLVDFATAEEASRHRNPLKEIAAISKNTQQSKKPIQTCHYCGQSSHGILNKMRLKQCPAYGKKCNKCQKFNHFASLCRSPKAAAITVENSDETGDEEAAVSGFVTAILPTLKITSSDTARPVVQKLKSQLASVTTLPVPHQIFCRQSKWWKRLPPKTSPTIELSVALDKPAYAELGLIPPELTERRGAGFARARRGTADTGAQLTVIHESELMALGVKKHSIFPVAMAVNTVTKTSIDLIGGIFLMLSSFNPTTGKNIFNEAIMLCINLA